MSGLCSVRVRRLLVSLLVIPFGLASLRASGPAPAAPRAGLTNPTFSKGFGNLAFPLGDTTSLTFTINNPNPVTNLTGLTFSDTLISGMFVATPNGASTTCGGTITAVAGSSSISFSGGTVLANSFCQVSVTVTGTAVGIVDNTSSGLTTNEGPTAGVASASVNVVGPPLFSKLFGAATVNQGQTTTLTFTVNNANNTNLSGTGGLSGVAFTDTLPAGLVIATPNGLTGTCGGGTITAIAGSNTVSLSGAALAVAASCTFGVNVTATGSGSLTNTTSSLTYTCPFAALITSSGRRTLTNPPPCTQFPATASLTVDPSVPLLGPGGLAAFALLLIGAALMLLRRRPAGRQPGVA